MYRFFVDKSQIDREQELIHILGNDVNHIKNVLRMNQRGRRSGIHLSDPAGAAGRDSGAHSGGSDRRHGASL